MSESIFDQCVNHLEFFGYSFDKKDEDGSILGKHEQKGMIFVRKYLGGILFQKYYKTNKNAKKNRLEYLEYINQLNSKANLATFSSESNEDLIRVDSCYFGNYDKQLFGSFLDAWHFDSRDFIFRHEKSEKFLE